MTDRLLLAQIDVSIRNLERTMKKAGVTVDTASNKMQKRWETNNRRMTRSSQTMARNIRRALAGVSAAAVLRISTSTIANFRQSMSTVQAVTGATASQFTELEASARNLGATTRFSASEAAEGMIALGRAGFDTDQVLASIEGTLQLAQAGALELGEAADIASNVLQGFRLSADETGRVVDVLASAANSSNTNVTELGQAMSFVAPIAAVAGVSVEEAAAAVGALSDAGIKATRAGTGLRQIILKLSAAGHDFSEEAGGLEGVLKNLAKQNIGLAEATKLVDVRQAGALLTLIDSVDKVGDLTSAYEGAAGSAKRVAEIMDDNLNGALLATRSRLQEMIISLGEAGGEEALIELLGSLQELLIFVAENADTFNKAIIVLSASMAGLIGGKALGGVITALGGYKKAIIAANVATGAATLSMRGLAVATRTFLAALGPVGLITVAAGAIAALAINTDNAAASFEKYEGTIADISKTNEDIQEDTKTLRQLHDELAKATIEGGEAAILAKTMEIGAINDRIAKNKELMALRRQSLGEQVAAGKDAILELERQKDKLANKQIGLFDSSRQSSGSLTVKQDDVFEGLLESGRNAGNEGRKRTKAEIKAAQISLDIAEANNALKEAEKRVNTLDEALRPKGLGLEHEGLSSFLKADEKAKAKPALASKKPKADKSVESQIRAIEELGRTEIEQIEFIKQKRLDAIAISGKAEEERSRLAAIVNQRALDDIAKVEDAQSKAQAEARRQIEETATEEREYHAEKSALMLEIEAAAARLHGRTIEAAQIEIDADRKRLEARLASYDEIERREAQLELARLDAAEAEIRDRGLQELDGLSGGGDQSDLDFELDRIDEIEREKLDLLESYRTTELESLRDFEAIKTQVIAEAEAARSDVRRAAFEEQINQTQQSLSTLKNNLKEGSKAQKIAARAEQAIAIGRIAVSTATGVAKALEGPFPLNLLNAALVGAAGAAQIAAAAAPGFKDGVVSLNGPGTTTSDSIDARLSRGESVLTAAATRGNEAGLRGLNAGLSPEQAFGFNAPIPNLRAPSSRPISNSSSSNFVGGDFVVQGNLDATTADRVMAEFKRYQRGEATRFRKMSEAREKRTTTRSQRPNIGGR